MCWLAAEKRVNFTLQARAVCAPAFDHFMACIAEAQDGAHALHAEEVPVRDVPQRFQYDRGHHLVLLKLQLLQHRAAERTS